MRSLILTIKFYILFSIVYVALYILVFIEKIKEYARKIPLFQTKTTQYE
jgi:hypothetical protein